MKKQIDWRGWKITDKQANLIREGNEEARNAFYFDNLDRIRAMAFNYAKRNFRCYGWVDDMVSNLYLDLVYFKSENGKQVVDGYSLSSFVYSSFRFTPYGGLLYLSKNNPKLLCAISMYTVNALSLDSPFGISDNRHQDDYNSRTLGEVIPASEIFDEVDYTDDLKTLVSDLLTSRENEYFSYFIEGYGNSEISRKMGYKTDVNNADRVRRKLRNNVAVILSRMQSLGINVDRYDGKTPYNPKNDHTYKLSSKQRAKAAESMRKQRAAKKANTLGIA